MYLNKFLLPGAGVSYEGKFDHRVGLLWDDFKAHDCTPVKDFF